MRNLVLATFMILCFGIANTQSKITTADVGDVYLIGDASENTYQHINFPKPNFIIKKGGIVNYKNLSGKKIVITSITEGKDGRLLAKIKLLSGGKFFNSHKYLTVEITEAIAKKELLKVDS